MSVDMDPAFSSGFLDYSSNRRFCSSLSKPLLRKWNCKGSTDFNPSQFILPIFVINKDEVEAIPSMPDVFRYGPKKVIEFLEPLVNIGLESILLFPVMEMKGINYSTDSEKNAVLRLIPLIKSLYPHLVIITDVCLCAFTEDGHCCFFKDNKIDYERSIRQLSEISLAYAFAGSDIVAPSDMMDNRVAAIRDILDVNNFRNVSIMSYSAKFASSLYGPFRDAAGSAPKHSDRKGYQLPIGSKALALRAVHRDIKEGADIVLIKPGTLYLDIISNVSVKYPIIPLGAYHVSGEYSMLRCAASNNLIDLRLGTIEVMTAFRRAGADIIITYLTPFILDWLKQGLM